MSANVASIMPGIVVLAVAIGAATLFFANTVPISFPAIRRRTMVMGTTIEPGSYASSSGIVMLDVMLNMPAMSTLIGEPWGSANTCQSDLLNRRNIMLVARFERARI